MQLRACPGQGVPIARGVQPVGSVTVTIFSNPVLPKTMLYIVDYLSEKLACSSGRTL